MAEEVKIVNDSMTCFSQEGWLKRGLNSERLLIKNLSQSLKSECNLSLKNPWKVLEICLSEVVTNHVYSSNMWDSGQLRQRLQPLITQFVVKHAAGRQPDLWQCKRTLRWSAQAGVQRTTPAYQTGALPVERVHVHPSVYMGSTDSLESGKIWTNSSEMAEMRQRNL